jgi:recombinational DNA repair protein RecR
MQEAPKTRAVRTHCSHCLNNTQSGDCWCSLAQREESGLITATEAAEIVYELEQLADTDEV